MSNEEKNNTGQEIAIIGLSGRFPGANNVDEFWRNLCNGVESISFFSDEELASAGIDPVTLNDPNYVKAAGMLTGIELFDALFFGFSPREAEIMDPQHRLFLECAWEALEDAGYNSENYPGRIGVYAGAGMNTYLLFNLYPNPELVRSIGNFQTMIGNDKDFLPTRVSYKLDLRGPSVSVQTACSTSLSAICLACQSLLSYQSDMVLAGGVSLRLPAKAGYLYQQGGILSPDGHCRAFDAKSLGTVVGSGVGIVVLKRLEDALVDGDYIHAVIKGYAINNDGALKVGYTAPSIDGQVEVIAEAVAMAEIDSESISYVETHGTGTVLGDPIEIAALSRVFRTHTRLNSYCAIGSVKTNVGHLDTAAGVAGLIKTVCSLKHKLLPPSLHFETANPNIDFANSPFYVNNRLCEWPSGNTPRRAGVSSFGIGGTNAHVILEESPALESSSESRDWQLLVLSAKTGSALEKATENLIVYLQQHPDTNLADVAYTLQQGRKAFSHRRMVVCCDIDDAVKALSDPQRIATAVKETINRPIAFMFPGQGSQYLSMGLTLYNAEPVFRENIDNCAKLLKSQLGLDIRDTLFSLPNNEKTAQQLAQTAITQPVLFVFEYALAKLWMEWDIYPQAMIGHSLGEYVAACLSGVISLEDALAVVATRGQLMQQLPAGAMLAISRTADEAQLLLGEQLSLAAINGPNSCVISGPFDAIEELEKHLKEENTDCKRLNTSHAFHSSMMQPILEAFTQRMKNVDLQSPQIPYISNVTGKWITAAEATDPNYWVKHLRETVHFAAGVEELLKEPGRILLEIGPGQILSALARKYSTKTDSALVLSSLPHLPESTMETRSIIDTLGKLWLAGVPINWSDFYVNEQRRRIPLPTYPFERQRYWIEPQTHLNDREKVLSVGELEIAEEDSRSITKPSILHARPNLQNTYIAPSNDIEKRIAKIWQELLGIDQVGIYDNFLELGGHSLLATQVISRLRTGFQVELPLRSLFESPTVAGLANSIEAARLLEQSLTASSMRPIARDGELPLSFAQQRLWFLDQLVPGNPFYNVPAAVRLEGSLNVKALEESLAEILHRHEALRTSFISVEGRPVQVISPSQSLILPLIDLQCLSETNRESEVLRLIDEEAKRPFDLTRAPLLRAALLYLAVDHYVLLITMHHIVSDGWSMGIFVREVLALYEAFVTAKPPTLPELPIQYADFAYWQRQWFQGTVLETQLSYWKEKLGGTLPILELPTDRPRPAIQSFRGACQYLLLSRELTQSLNAMSQRESVTLFMTLLAAFQTLLHRYTGESDIIVGSGIANRNRVEIEELIGFFVNTMVLRTDLSGRPSFQQLLGRVRETALAAYAHQDLPFEQLVEELQPKRDLSHAPLFQVAFILQNAPMPTLEIPGLKLQPIEIDSGTSKFDLTFSLTETPQGLNGQLEYNTDLFDVSTITRLLNHYRVLLESILVDTTQSIVELPILSESEQRQLLVAWNNTAADYPQDQCIHQLFELQALQTPEATAVVFVNSDSCLSQLSYQELNAHANKLARYLRKIVVGPETVVGICLNCSLDMIISVLG
ncbi:MAG: condensation domain-containing protein, partial [Acidobacteriota bacterium]